MSIVSEIERIKANIANAYNSCLEKGATMPSILNSANLANCIASITGGEPDEPITNEYVDGATAIWTAEDGLNESNQWIDRINGYGFTPISSIIPVHDSNSKLLNFNAYGGMLSNFKPENKDYTIEIVTRDIRNCKGSTTSSNEGVIITTAAANTGLSGITFMIKPTSIGICQINDNSSQRQMFEKTNFEQNSMDTFSTTPTEQVLNGEIVKTYTSNPVHTTELALCHRKNFTGLKAQVKIHCIRYYPFKLTTEQLAHNREVDIAIFGE